MNNIEKGKLGEDMAVNYLLSKGYKILSRNYRYKTGEIDIIARERDILVFLEVKARTSRNYGYAYEAVNKKKQEKIINTSHVYCSQYAYHNFQLRYDIIEVYLTREIKINHIIDAFCF